MAHLKIFYANNSERNFSYLLESSGRVWIIDPFDPQPIINYIKKNDLKLQGILNTHKHWDHVKGNLEIQNTLGIGPLLINNEEKLTLDDDDFLQVINSPGHTFEHQVYIWEHKTTKIGLFSGDTIFNAGVGNCKNGGNPELLFETIQSLKKLPEEIIIYPGHDYARKNLQFALSVEPENADIETFIRHLDQTNSESGLGWTLGDEFKFNPFFRLNSEKIRQKLNLTQIEDSHNTERDVFLKLRKLRDNW